MSGVIRNYNIHTCPHCGNEEPFTQEEVKVFQNELGTALEVAYNCPNCGEEVVEVYTHDWRESHRLSEEK